jgi:hypothetical protein
MIKKKKRRKPIERPMDDFNRVVIIIFCGICCRGLMLLAPAENNETIMNSIYVILVIAALMQTNDEYY